MENLLFLGVPILKHITVFSKIHFLCWQELFDPYSWGKESYYDGLGEYQFTFKVSWKYNGGEILERERHANCLE